MDRFPAPTAPGLPPDALELLHCLAQARVEYVLIGDLALLVHGLPWADPTVTIVPARFSRNLERLSTVLHQLHAVWVVPGESVSLVGDLSPTGLRRLGRWPLRCDRGGLEIDFEPPATAGHLDLFEGARRVAVRVGLDVEVASRADLARIAEMRGGPADLAPLQTLRAAQGAVASAPAPA